MNLTWERRRLAGVVMSSRPDVEALSMDRRRLRQVLECASLLALWRWSELTESARGLAQSKTLLRDPQVHGPDTFEKTKRGYP